MNEENEQVVEPTVDRSYRRQATNWEANSRKISMFSNL